MSEVKDLHNLVIEQIETLDAPKDTPLTVVLVGPPVSTRSSFTHVLRKLLAYFSLSSSRKSYKTTYFRTYEGNNEVEQSLIPKEIETKSGNIEKLLEHIQAVSPNLLFFVDYPEITDGILNQLGKKGMSTKFHVWQYFKPRTNVLSNQVVEWLSKKVDRIFVPSEFYEQTLKLHLAKKLDILHIPVSASYFKMDRETVERMIELPKLKFRWLCPDSFQETSQIDTVISAFAKYVVQDAYKDDQLLLLGNMADFDCYPVLDIYANELLNLGKDIKDYTSNLILLNNESVARLTDDHLNKLYNSCDYVVSTRNFCSHSFSFLNLARLGLPMLLPNHTWFVSLATDYSGVTLQPIYHAQYNTMSSFGIKYFVSPSALAEKMKELRNKKNEDGVQHSWQQTQENFTNLLDKRLQILKLETSAN
jgi:hypothetical protein